MKTPAPHCKKLAYAQGGWSFKRAYIGSWALAAETLDLSITINLVVLENSQLGLLALVLDLLGSGVNLGGVS
jgi:hypothetical protein